MKITYTRIGDILIPDLTVGEQPDKTPIGKYGLMRKEYLKEHKTALYGNLILSTQLQTHLKEIDKQARELIEKIISEKTKIQGVDEKLKARNPMKWVGLMNSIKQQAEEQILNELIYA